MTNRTKTISRDHFYFASVLTLLLSLVSLYIYFLSATVVHVVMQKEISNTIHEVHSDIAKLEAEYINRQHAVSNMIASNQGFIEAEDKIFIDKSDVSLVMSTR